MVERPHGEPEQEAAVQYLIEHWKSYRLEGKRLQLRSMPLTELYDKCIGTRTTLWGPGVGFKVQGLPEDIDTLVVLVPQNIGKYRYWFDLNTGYTCVGRLVRMGLVEK